MGEVDIYDYMEKSLSHTSNRTVTEMVLISVGMSLYTVFGVLGNGLVLVALYTQRKWAGLDSVMMIFIANLTISDFLICLMTFPPTAICAAVDHWVLGQGLCWIVSVFITYLRITAILFMTLICIHRVIVISFPFDNIISERKGKVCSFIIWIISTIPQIGPFVGHNPFHYDPIRAVCIADLHHEGTISKLLSMVYAIIYVAIPMILITLFYTRILYIAISNEHKRNTAMRVSDSGEKRGSKAIVTTLILVGSFILCFLPFLVITGVNQITNDVSDEVIVYGEFSSSFHCVVNPYILFYANQTFRDKIMKPIYNLLDIVVK